MRYLLDTNVLSELRKGDRCDPSVRGWFLAQNDEALFTSVLCLGEIRLGIEAVRRRDARFAARLFLWLDYTIEAFAGRILHVDQVVALTWGRMAGPKSRAPIDELLAATAHRHGMTFVTRNLRDVERTGVPCLNPFSSLH